MRWFVYSRWLHYRFLRLPLRFKLVALEASVTGLGLFFAVVATSH